jgi:hypothetical protein
MRLKISSHVLPYSLRRNTARTPAAVALVVLFALSGCAAGGLGDQAAAPAAPSPPTDPVVAFAAQAQPGSESRITLPGGQSTTARLARSYNAASGRECREVLLGTGAAQHSRLVCQAENGGWVAARPLLLGAVTGRP